MRETENGKEREAERNKHPQHGLMPTVVITGPSRFPPASILSTLPGV